jgi:uridine kinase
MLDQLANRLIALQIQRPVRVAVDGTDAAGKTTLADELALLLTSRGRTVIRASIDGSHRPRAERYRQGANSPEGYYADSFDHEALCSVLLQPLGPHGSRRFRRAVFDFRTDTPRSTKEELAREDAILLFDGVFLLRPELDHQWDYRIFVDAHFAVTVSEPPGEIVIYSAPQRRRERVTRSAMFPASKSTWRPLRHYSARRSSCRTMIPSIRR